MYMAVAAESFATSRARLSPDASLTILNVLPTTEVYLTSHVCTNMNLPPNSERHKRFRKKIRDFFTSASVAEPSATTLSPGTARNSHDAVTSQDTASLHVPTSRPSSRIPSPNPGPRERTREPQASAISSAVSVDSATQCVRTQGQAHAVQASTILADALEKLEEQERKTIRELLCRSTFKIDDALHEACDKAKELQARSAMKRWSWTYRGRQVYVQDQADKLVRFIDKFKAVGDAAASIDPVHAGLPWAGVRSILEVSYTSEMCPLFYVFKLTPPVSSPFLIAICEAL